jgi:hypothetical protein
MSAATAQVLPCLSTAPGDLASAYAARGWRTFPVHTARYGRCSCGVVACPAVAKHPLTRHSFKDATTNASTLRAWFQVQPDANVAVVTGAASGLVVLDVDPEKGGLESLAALERRHGTLPSTVRVRTGGLGVHLYFKHPGGTVPNRTNLAPGIDVRGDGGYVVAPPSVHASGRKYLWYVWNRPDRRALAELPVWLLELILGSGESQPLARPVPVGPGRISKGSRNATLHAMARSMHAKGFSAPAIAAALDVENQARCVPPLDDAEVHKIARNAATQADRSDFVVHNGRRFEQLGRVQLKPAGENGESTDHASERQRLQLLTDTELEALPPPTFLVDDLLVERSFAVLFGSSGCGKSFVALDLALAVAAGRSWHGRTVRQGPAVYIAAEGGAAFQKRVAAWKAQHGLAQIPDARFLLHAANLLNPDDVKELLGAIGSLLTPPVLVVIDTLARSMDGGDENATKDMNAVVAAVDGIRTTVGCAVLLVHHTGHTNHDRSRGASSLSCAVDTEMRLTKTAGNRTLRCTKQKDWAEFPPIELRLVPTPDGSSCVLEDAGTTMALPATPISRDLATLRILVESFTLYGATHADWLAASQLGDSTFDRVRNRLVEGGYVEKPDEGRGARYRPTSKGAQTVHSHAPSTHPHGGSEGNPNSLSLTLTPLRGEGDEGEGRGARVPLGGSSP